MKNNMTFAQSLSPLQRELLLKDILQLFTPEERAKILTPGAAPKMPPDVSLETLRDRREITQHTLGCLIRAGLHTLHDVYEMSPRALMNIRHIGKKSFSEIVDILRDHEYDVSTFEMWEQGYHARTDAR